jgi:hypothetical protein
MLQCIALIYSLSDYPVDPFSMHFQPKEGLNILAELKMVPLCEKNEMLYRELAF